VTYGRHAVSRLASRVTLFTSRAKMAAADEHQHPTAFLFMATIKIFDGSRLLITILLFTVINTYICC
jgi:hypothetical protein